MKITYIKNALKIFTGAVKTDITKWEKIIEIFNSITDSCDY